MPRKLDGSYIQNSTITTTQISSALNTTIQAGGGPRIASIVYPGNDTAANTNGGQTLYVLGSGFKSNSTIYINGNAASSVTYVSSSNLSFTGPALSAATYPLYVINPEDGATAILVPGLQVSGEPTWVTGATLAEQDASSAWNVSLSATGDGTITYALKSGSTLPSGISLASNGVISGTLSSPPESDTTYNFTVIATDSQNQDAERAFSVTASTGEGVLFANNVLLIHADGTNNQNNHTFLDSSNNNFTITRNGNATQGSFSPFSQTGWSNYFDGTGDYLTTPSSSSFGFGTGSFTIECWVYPTSISSSAMIWGGTTAGALFVRLGQFGGAAYSGVQIGRVLTSNDTFSSFAFSANKWYHIAIVRNSSTITIYVNGTSINSFSNSTDYGSTVTGRIGAEENGGEAFQGYISNYRVVKGTAVYTSNFTPSTAALTAVSNTSLLTCQSNRIRDASNNNFTITRNGDVSVQAFSPFAPTAVYSTANVGGSAYFDGSGDYLTNTSGASASVFGTGDFTMECWLYYTASSTGNDDWMIYEAQASSGAFQLYKSTDNTLKYGEYGVLGKTILNSTDLQQYRYQWMHVAVVRSGSGSNNVSTYVNGVRVAQFTDTTNYSKTGISIGARSGTQSYPGYISGMRMVTGTAVYSGASFSLPTAPLTAIANTSLLLNFTNAGIFDQTAKNVLETVGNAKLSTAQYKYGSASMYFDGSGDWIYSPTTVQFNPIQKFTVEFWTYPNANTTVSWIVGSSAKFYIESNAGTLYVGDGTTNIISTAPPSTGAWTHVALTYDGTTYRLFYNGTSQANSTTSLASNVLTAWYIGARHDGTRNFDGYIDDLRITKGYARYTTNFTAPTSALKDK